MKKPKSRWRIAVFPLLAAALAAAAMALSAAGDAAPERTAAPAPETPVQTRQPAPTPATAPPAPTAAPEPEPEPKPEPIDYAALVDEEVWGPSAVCMAQMARGEDPHGAKERKAAMYWVVTNRVDDQTVFAGQDTIIAVVTAENQFFGYGPGNGVDPEDYALALDTIGRWLAEKEGAADVGRVLPREYLYFHGDGMQNYFTTGDLGQGRVWDWSLPNPYETEEAG